MSFDFDAIGCRWEIETPTPLTEAVRTQVLDCVERFDKTWSRFRTDSLIAHLARSGGRVDFGPDAVELFELYDRLRDATGGAVDPLVGRDLERLGYDARYSLRPSTDPPPVRRPSWTTDVQRESGTLTTSRPMLVDVGAAGKGRLVDLIARLLLDAGIDEYLIDGSGDLIHRGHTPIRIGLEDPADPTRAIGVVELHNQALAASSINRRAWGDDLHHLIDGRTGTPTREVTSTWAIADQAALADGLATALFFAAPNDLAQTFAFSGVRLLVDRRAETTGRFDGELFH